MICPKCGYTEFTTSKVGDYNSYLAINNGYGLGLLLAYLFRKHFQKHYGDLCICNRCAHRWYAKRLSAICKNRAIMTQHLGKAYPLTDLVAPDGSGLRLDLDGLCMYRLNKKRLNIPFDELVAVDYHSDQDTPNHWLTIRHKAQIKRSFPRNLAQAQKDRLTVICSFGSEQLFYQVYLALHAVVEENKKAGLL